MPLLVPAESLMTCGIQPGMTWASRSLAAVQQLPCQILQMLCNVGTYWYVGRCEYPTQKRFKWVKQLCTWSIMRPGYGSLLLVCDPSFRHMYIIYIYLVCIHWRNKKEGHVCGSFPCWKSSESKGIVASIFEAVKRCEECLEFSSSESLT